jgi:hypothetical protein
MSTCPNPACKKVFNAPLKALNLQDESAEPYSACPYCLTPIVEEKIEINWKHEKEQEDTSQAKEKEKSSKNKEKPADCHYHFGYLSEREQKGQIPDECVVCQDIVDCMLRKMRM